MAKYACATCGKSTNNLCTGCKSIAYCFTDCQKIDRPLHKLLCSAYLPFLATRPEAIPGAGAADGSFDLGSSFIAAIHFPEDEQAPKLVWIERQLIERPGDEVHIYCSVGTIVGEYETMQHARSARGQKVMTVISTNAMNTEPKNICIAGLLKRIKSCDGYRAVRPSPWYGNVLVLAMDDDEMEQGAEDPYQNTGIKDVTLAELRTAFENFFTGGLLCTGLA